MAKKEIGKSDAPIVTSLPLPSSDSVLVIDLPDGQKLLVGKMAPGSVIEVATWRGTGRPDSRTNRLMLGMSNGENPEAVENSETNEAVSKFSLAYALYILRNVPPYLVQLSSRIYSRLKKPKEKSELATVEKSGQEDIEAWLKKITNSVSTLDTKQPLNTSKSKSAPKSGRKTPQKVKTSSKK